MAYIRLSVILIFFAQNFLFYSASSVGGQNVGQLSLSILFGRNLLLFSAKLSFGVI